MILLQREYARSSREKRIYNLTQATKVGILYYCKDEETYEKISKFVKKLQGAGKTVKALGYVESKSLTGQFLPKLSYDYLYPNGLNWNYKPVSVQAKDFIDSNYDILIDLSLEESVPLLYITALSKASFKAGLQSKNRSNYLDLMISLPEDGELEELMKQVHHYLTEINKENES